MRALVFAQRVVKCARCLLFWGVLRRVGRGCWGVPWGVNWPKFIALCWWFVSLGVLAGVAGYSLKSPVWFR